ncbi:MAG: energy transducer TonB [Bacteroidota bacterium]
MSTRTRNFWILTTFIALGFAMNNWFNFTPNQTSCLTSSSYTFHHDTDDEYGYSSYEERWEKCQKRKLQSRKRSTCSAVATPLLTKQAYPINKYEVKKAIGPAADGTQGYILMRVKVDENGQYVAHKIMVKGSDALTDACERHIDKLTFTPAYENGEAVQSWVSVSFDF